MTINEPATDAAPTPSEPSALVKEIDAWFVEHFHGSIVSQSTPIFNHVHAAVQDLKARLAKES